MKKRNNVSFRMDISAVGFILFAAVVLILPMRVLFSWTIAVTVHECFHCLMIAAVGKRILSVKIDVSGMKIITPPMTPVQELLCAVAGPVGSFALILLVKWLPEAALFGLIQGIYNLLPCYPSDGGRIVRILFVKLLCLQYGKKICMVLEWVTIIAIAVITYYVALYFRVWCLMIPGLLVAVSKIKFSCKQSRERVQYGYQ